MDRKTFINQCGIACLGSLAIGGLIAGCSTSTYLANATLQNNLLLVKKSEFVQVKNNITTARKFVLVRTEKLPFPIGVYHLQDNNYSALLMQCTHKGCELQPNNDYLICPCHGSEFSNMGVVQNPPAEQNLQSFKVTVDNENIYIHLV